MYCLKRIEEKTGWKPISEWTDHDFKLLKNQIYECSNISISTHTLKRLFGKIKYKDNYTPQHATKDALATFLDYGSWEEFVRSSPDEIRAFTEQNGNQELKTVEKKKTGRSMKQVYWLVSAAVLVIAATVVILVLAGNRKIPPFSFTIKNAEDSLPHTVRFTYDVTGIRSDQAFIEFDFTHPILGNEFILADNKNSFVNHTYQVPGVYHPRLMLGNMALDSLVVVTESEGWVSFYQKHTETDRYWLDNMFINLKFDGFLTFSRPDIVRQGLDTTGIYYTTHRNIRDYGLPGDNFKLETRFVNSPESGGISCFDASFTVVCEHSDSYIRMMEENCSQFCRLKFGEKYYDGVTSDLSFLARDLTRWNLLRIEVIDKQAAVYFNDELIHEEAFTQEPGKIKGLNIRFKGSGLVDYLLLTSVEGDTAYFADFKEKAHL